MKLKINNIDYKIVFVDNIIDGYSEDLGRFFGDNRIIEISNNQNLSRMKATIKHEITHAYLYSFGLQQDSYDEEFICNFVELYSNQITKDCDKIYNNIVKKGDKNMPCGKKKSGKSGKKKGCKGC